MIIQVNPDLTVTLEDRDNFKAFKIRARAGDTDGLAIALTGIAELGGDHAWVWAAALRGFDAQLDDSDWWAGVTAMIEKARAYGWVDDRDRIRAHIEFVEGSP